MIAYQVNTVSGLARYFGFKEKKNVINSFVYANFNNFDRRIHNSVKQLRWN